MFRFDWGETKFAMAAELGPGYGNVKVGGRHPMVAALMSQMFMSLSQLDPRLIKTGLRL